MLTRGINHVAIMTSDTDRLHAFYCEVFDGSVFADRQERDLRFSIVNLGPTLLLNTFEITANRQAEADSKMFERGRIDHVGIEASSKEAFDTLRDRLIAKHATDGFVTDYGAALGMFFSDPDGLVLELCLVNPAVTADDLKPPGTPALGYTRIGTP